MLAYVPYISLVTVIVAVLVKAFTKAIAIQKCLYWWESVQQGV